ncbi:response regulator transcription factor [Ornithinimicrobium faecis]|uniref:Response regulator transcription factor n=1 Tax=Ornithinimicrobium faecis TaxID=2934158 RepID=A0ABY4YTB6_9MICO|nr:MULTISPECIES: response regulator transcription factor [unclassified Ornithinimicrobium]USQ80005.1 response regulator transcription factor [Ornithinimicrobium sp. HY1793]
MISVLVVDDDAMVRSGFAAILGSEPDLEVVGEAADGAEALTRARQVTPDVVVMDVRMPRLDGIEATRRLLRADDPPRVLVVTTFEHDSYVLEALEAGAHGFLLKRAGADQLVHAVRTVAAVDGLLFPDAIRDLVRRTARPARVLPALSTREAEVLRLLARGHSNAEIAAELFLGRETVKTYVRSLLTKLDARDRTQAVIAAFESGFVGTD